ncbi:MAG: NAD(P)H-hydrate epimerase, partial [Clostridia bacterium]|nr:NAD(P)H-hydrate epimerase [Clostridia bacterium]
MIKVVSVKTMRESDRQTIASGISGIELMRRAAEGIYRSAQWRPPVAIVCGTGNNGGDGYAVAN